MNFCRPCPCLPPEVSSHVPIEANSQRPIGLSMCGLRVLAILNEYRTNRDGRIPASPCPLSTPCHNASILTAIPKPEAARGRDRHVMRIGAQPMTMSRLFPAVLASVWAGLISTQAAGQWAATKIVPQPTHKCDDPVPGGDVMKTIQIAD